MKRSMLLGLLIVPLLLVGCAKETTPPTTNLVVPTTTAPVVTTTTKPATSAPVTTALPPPTTSKTPVSTATSAFKMISADDLYALVKVSYDPLSMATDANAPYVTVDARLVDSWNIAHIPAAISIPPNSYNTDIGQQEIEYLLQNLPKGKLVVFWDDFVDVAPVLAQQFVDLNAKKNWGFDVSQIRILSGGFDAWNEKNYPNLSAAQ